MRLQKPSPLSLAKVKVSRNCSYQPAFAYLTLTRRATSQLSNLKPYLVAHITLNCLNSLDITRFCQANSNKYNNQKIINQTSIILISSGNKIIDINVLEYYRFEQLLSTRALLLLSDKAFVSPEMSMVSG